MFAQLGNHTFQGLKSPHSWSESYSKRYSQIPLIDQKEAIQPAEEELSRIKLSILYSIDFCDPASEIYALKQSMKSSEVLPFISGEGNIIGTFVIVRIEVQNETLSQSGTLEVAAIELELLESVDTESEQPPAEALASADPVAEPPAQADESPANAIINKVLSAKNAISVIKDRLGDIKKGIDLSKLTISEIKQLVDWAKQDYEGAKTKLEACKKIFERADRLPASLGEAVENLKNMATEFGDVFDIEDLQESITEMENRSDEIMKFMSSVVAFSASKEGGS